MWYNVLLILSYLCNSGTDHWETLVLLTDSSVSNQLNLSSKDLQKQVVFRGEHVWFVFI